MSSWSRSPPWDILERLVEIDLQAAVWCSAQIAGLALAHRAAPESREIQYESLAHDAIRYAERFARLKRAPGPLTDKERTEIRAFDSRGAMSRPEYAAAIYAVRVARGGDQAKSNVRGAVMQTGLAIVAATKSRLSRQQLLDDVNIELTKKILEMEWPTTKPTQKQIAAAPADVQVMWDRLGEYSLGENLTMDQLLSAYYWLADGATGWEWVDGLRWREPVSRAIAERLELID